MTVVNFKLHNLKNYILKVLDLFHAFMFTLLDFNIIFSNWYEY